MGSTGIPTILPIVSNTSTSVSYNSIMTSNTLEYGAVEIKDSHCRPMEDMFQGFGYSRQNLRHRIQLLAVHLSGISEWQKNCSVNDYVADTSTVPILNFYSIISVTGGCTVCTTSSGCA